MGQYWKPVNLTKREYIDPHKLGNGLKLGEQIGGGVGVGSALVILIAAERENRGGGDLDIDENWHGPERVFPEHNISPGPMPEDYRTIAKRTIGRWAGDRIVMVGDYSEDGDLPDSPIPFGSVYDEAEESFTDVTDDVARVIEHELQGKFEGTGWRGFKYTK